MVGIRIRRSGFSLVELLVVIGIISLLIGILLPSLNKAQNAARKVACAANMRQLGAAIFMYGNDYRGWIFPVGAWDDPSAPGQFLSLGSNVEPHLRWPMYVYKFAHPPLPGGPYSPRDPGDGEFPNVEIQPWTRRSCSVRLTSTRAACTLTSSTSSW
jgi:prepilin-type N-terminal cleavage/methylation domain-containing protein